jgi:pimeloyl-ACP methyl ester carboxylesterase
MLTVTSSDGTPIAFDRLGAGAPLILIGGALCDRASTRPLASALAADFSVISYDRRGRGDSGDHAPYTVEREIDDLGALIASAGGSAAVYGHSSGAAVALRAAAHGLPISALVLHEPPFGPNDTESRRGSQALSAKVNDLLADDRRTDAAVHFLTTAGMPPEHAGVLGADPRVQALAHTLAYDFAVLDLPAGGTVPTDEVTRVTAETLVAYGTASAPFFADTARRINDLLPNSRLTVLDGQSHEVPAEILAPVLTGFLKESHR